MEGYKEKYEEALKNLKTIRNCNKNNETLVRFIENKYPELKESEDENVRKHLLKHFRNKTKEEWNGMPVKNILAWLEKQKDHEDELEKAYKTADEVQYRKGFEDGVASVKPAEWSDLDEKYLELSLENLTELKNRFGAGYGKVSACIYWLQSLKQRMKGE